MSASNDIDNKRGKAFTAVRPLFEVQAEQLDGIISPLSLQGIKESLASAYLLGQASIVGNHAPSVTTVTDGNEWEIPQHLQSGRIDMSQPNKANFPQNGGYADNTPEPYLANRVGWSACIGKAVNISVTATDGNKAMASLIDLEMRGSMAKGKVTAAEFDAVAKPVKRQVIYNIWALLDFYKKHWKDGNTFGVLRQSVTGDKRHMACRVYTLAENVYCYTVQGETKGNSTDKAAVRNEIMSMAQIAAYICSALQQQGIYGTGMDMHEIRAMVQTRVIGATHHIFPLNLSATLDGDYFVVWHRGRQHRTRASSCVAFTYDFLQSLATEYNYD